ncbi:MAG: ATP-binding protein [Candidatus Lokiarchaeota archaeon]|nr:ATP-binding protein [Candidatus Lokiarchaeota archaeon]
MQEEIIIQNLWWKTKSVSESKLGSLKRAEFSKLLEEIEDNKVTCLLGPRRTGKTTMMYDLIDHLLNNGVSEKNIFFISFDNPKIRLVLQHDFDSTIRDFSNTIVREPIDRLSSKVYIVLDEVHKLDDWGNMLKYWQDLGLNIKFIVSGSSSMRILKGSGESLLGRINFHLILPLNFSEFTGIDVRADFRDYNDIKRVHDSLMLEKQELFITLDEYIIKGGYPEVFYIKDVERAYEVLKQYKTLTISRDILDLKDIKEPRTLSDLTDLLSDVMSTRMNYSTFAQVLGVKVDTVKNYISYLEECFLVYTAYFYSKKQVTSTRKEKKLFFMDCGLRNSLLLKEIDELEKTKIVENLVFLHIFSLKKRELFPKIFYWLDRSRNEVDMVVTLKNEVVPIEVKYSNEIGKRDLKGLVRFCEEFDAKGIVVTRDILKEEGNIMFIPAWLFLLITS